MRNTGDIGGSDAAVVLRLVQAKKKGTRIFM